MSLVITAKRRIVQAVSLFLLNSNFWGVAGGVRFCVPVMNCEACVLAWLGCPIGAMGSSIGFHEFPWLVLFLVLAAGAVLGRAFCGWICPLGFLQDLLYKIPGLKFGIPRFLTWFKYGFLVITVFGAAYFLGKESLFFFCSFCPTSALEVVIPDMIRHGDYAVTVARALKLGVLVVVLILAIANHRSFCKIMCPIGALVALTNKFSLFSIRLNKDKCIKCRKCDKNCPMDVAVMDSQNNGRAVSADTECIECLTCKQVCPTAAITDNSRLFPG